MPVPTPNGSLRRSLLGLIVCINAFACGTALTLPNTVDASKSINYLPMIRFFELLAAQGFLGPYSLSEY